jgi:beta-glucosidase
MRKIPSVAVALILSLAAAGARGQVASQPGRGDASRPLYLDPSLPLEARARDLISRLTLEEKATLLHHNGPTVERFNILSDKWNQCLHGVVWDRPTTMFPISIAAAATWNPDLIHQEATVISDEARAIYNRWHLDPAAPGQKKGLIYRAPVINISRNPYWGRIAECYGEDPYLTGRIGVAFVKGLQGDDPKYLKLVSTLKHYAVNNVEQGRMGLSATVSERMLHEYWLPHFKDCIVEGKAQSVMASYNAINGVPSNINKLMLTDILKTQWGFEGFVVSDLGGVNTMVRDHTGGQMSFEEAVSKSILAGCDFSDREYMQYIPPAVRQGLLPEARVDDALLRVMRNRIRLGEFDPAELVPYSKISPDVICSPPHRAMALKVARESMVLLKNEGGLLPLNRASIKKVAVIGPHANVFTPGGYSGRASNPVTPLQGLRNRLGESIELLTALGAPFGRAGGGRANRGAATAPATAPAVDPAVEIANAVTIAKAADVALLFVGTNTTIEAEGRDRTRLDLPGNQQELVQAVFAANPRTVVILMNAGPLTIPWINENVPAILEAWWGGEEGGNAIADVLFGDVNPGGRLPFTVYASAEQVPPIDEYDISKGFTYMYVKGRPLYPFGHGLSYTSFSYQNLQLSAREMPPAGKVSVNLEVSNTGSRPGDEVVQLYTRQVNSSVVRPARELRGFQRITLQPGEKRSVSLELPAAKLGFYDEKVHVFTTEPGTYEIMLGSSSDQVRLKTEVRVVP